MAPTFTIDQYPDACCSDCEHYEQEGQQRCAVAEEALAYALDANGKPYNFGDDIRIVIPATTSKCERFATSTSYQLDLAEARAWRAEQAARQNAVRMGAHS